MALLTNITLICKGLQGTNTLAYCSPLLVTKTKQSECGPLCL